MRGNTIGFLFGLAPGGVCPAVRVTTNAVRSYRTFSPLPTGEPVGRYIFCGTFHRLTPSRRYLAPCPVEPGLSSAVYREATHLDAGRNTAAAARPTPGKTIVLTGPDGKFSLNLHHFQPIQAAGGNNRFSVRREAGRKPVQLQPAAGNH